MNTTQRKYANERLIDIAKNRYTQLGDTDTAMDQTKIEKKRNTIVQISECPLKEDAVSLDGHIRDMFDTTRLDKLTATRTSKYEKKHGYGKYQITLPWGEYTRHKTFLYEVNFIKCTELFNQLQAAKDTIMLGEESEAVLAIANFEKAIK